MEKMDISIIIPAYNESERILPTLEKICRYMKEEYKSFEIIIVDDGSKDDTVEVLEKFIKKYPQMQLLKHKVNSGKGAAIKTGVMSSKGRLILFSDADLSTPIEELKKLNKAILDGYDISIASRGLKDSNIVIPQPFHRRLAGKIFPLLVRLIVLKDFRDTQCGFKLFTKEAGLFLFSNLQTESFAFDVEILYRAIKNNLKVKEVPVKWINSDISKVNIFTDPIKMFISLFKIRAQVK
jgi:dolichyl-phosphate beta-glucosyltransferase